MKKKFSNKWESSKQPRKQRKYTANAPLHIRKKFVRVNLSKELRTKNKKRNIQLKKGDIVKIMRGKFKDKKGKVLEIKLSTSKIIIEGIQVKKMDGSSASVKMQPSNLQILELSERRSKKLKSENLKKEKSKENKDAQKNKEEKK